MRWARRFGPVLVVLALLGAACGDDDDDPGDGAAADDGAFDPDGIVRAPSPMSQSTASFDPIDNQTSGMGTVGQLVYDTLLRERPDRSLAPGLAKRAEIVDPQAIEVELHEGIEFSDGTPLDADAVAFNILRNRDSKNGGAFRSTLFQVASVDVTSTTELTIRLTGPVAGAFMSLLADVETYVLSPTALQAGHDFGTAPIGAGPFLLESYTNPDSPVVLRKNPDYFQADEIKLAGIEFVPAVAGPAIVNGLRSGQLDVANVVSTSAADVSDPPLTSETVAGNAVHAVQICKTTPPFDDVRVRRALSLATDRKAINEAVYQGLGEVAYDRHPAGSAFHNAEMAAKYEYDPDRAERLLQEAGVATPLEVGIVYNSANVADPIFFEVLQQQWAEIGVMLRPMASAAAVNDYYVRRVAPFFNVNMTSGGQPLDNIIRILTGTNIGNVCQYNDPAFNQLVTDLQAVDSMDESDPDVVELWQELNGKLVDDVLHIFAVFSPQTLAWNQERIGNVEIVTAYYGAAEPNYRDLYVKAD